jgi:uncharacterized protein (TIGR02996 family)
MDRHLPFLKAIAANPPNDLLRLVYADFLEENGQSEWASFIRLHVQIENKSIGSVPQGTDQHDHLRELLALTTNRHLSAWLNHLLDAVRPVIPWVAAGQPLVTGCHHLDKAQFDVVRWKRGFPEVIELREHILHQAGGLFERWPVTGLRLQDQYTFEQFSTLVFLSKLTSLEVKTSNLPHPVGCGRDVWLHTPVLTHIRRLSFAFDHSVSPAWLVAFLAALPSASFSATLSELNFAYCYNITDAGANTLATARGLDRLTTLNLTGIPLSPPAVAMLRRRFGDRLRV